MQNRYNVGIVPMMVGMKVLVYDHQDERMKEFEGNMFQCLEWINKNVVLKETILMIHNVDMVELRHGFFQDVRKNMNRLTEYYEFKRKNRRRLPDEEYGFDQFKEDVFQELQEYEKRTTMLAVQKVVTEAFKMRNVRVIGCDGTPVEEKVKQKIQTRPGVPDSIPGGPNDNFYLVKRNK